MSQGEAIPLDVARGKAERLVDALRPGCDRIEIAGSIRRGKPLVSDIEIVAMPHMEVEEGEDLWGTPVENDWLDKLLYLMRQSGDLRLRAVENHRKDGRVEVTQRDGPSYKALEFEGFPVDLFIVRDAAQWGVIFTIRTGPADWSHRLVTDCQRFLRRVEGGYLYRSGQRWPCPTEEDFFQGIGQPWVEPSARAPERVAIHA